jgi:hypothetical protein
MPPPLQAIKTFHTVVGDELKRRSGYLVRERRRRGARGSRWGPHAGRDARRWR